MTKPVHYRSSPNGLHTRIDDVSGRIVKLRADEFGVITTETPEEQRVAAAFGLRRTRLPRMTQDEIVETAKSVQKEP